MSKYVGHKVKAYIATLDGAGEPILVAGQRDASYEINIESIDTSSKDSKGNWSEVIAGNRSWTVSFSGAHVLGDGSHDLLEDAVIEEEHTTDTGQVVVFLETEGGKIRHGNAMVTSFSLSASHTELATYDISLDGVGAVTKASDMPDAFTANFGEGSWERAVTKAQAEMDKTIKKKEKQKGEK